MVTRFDLTLDDLTAMLADMTTMLMVAVTCRTVLDMPGSLAFQPGTFQ